MDSLPPTYIPQTQYLVSRPLRTYEGIWKELRKKQVIVLVLVDHEFRTRIKRMIIKEKCMDKGFAIINTVERYHLRFQWDESKSELTVRLVSRFGLTEVIG